MWGTNQTLSTSGTGAVSISQQIANVQFRMPTTWRFMFTADVLSIEGGSIVGDLLVDFDLGIGLGRSNQQVTNFCRFRFPVADLTAGVHKSRWTCRAPAPLCDPTTGPDTQPQTENWVDQFPAESIQAVCRVTQLGAAGATTNVIVSAAFSPQSHVRPEWFIRRFTGGELAG